MIWTAFLFCYWFTLPSPLWLGSESFVKLDEKQAFDSAIRSSRCEAVPKRSKNGDREKVHGFSGKEAPTAERSKNGGDLASNVNVISKGEQQSLLANKSWKRKCKSSSLKVSAHTSFLHCANFDIAFSLFTCSTGAILWFLLLVIHLRIFNQ